LFSSNFLVFSASLSYRDVFLLYYICSTIIFLIMWKSEKHSGFLWLASLFAGFATFTKLEGTAYLVIFMFLMIYILYVDREMHSKEKLRWFIKYLIPSSGICAFYYCYKSFMQVSTSEFVGLNIMNVTGRFYEISDTLFRALFLTANWNIIWIMLVLSLAYNFSRVTESQNICVLLLAVIMFFGMHFLIALTSDVGAFMMSSVTISRLILHFFPLSISLVIFLNSPHYKENK